MGWGRLGQIINSGACVMAGAVMILAVGLIHALNAEAATESRVALVIGNGSYAEAPLRNPVNDARAMAAALRDLKFDVTLLENADRVTMQRASLDFGRKLKDDVVGLFYFAGHGMQVKGVNYLIPISAHVGSEEEVEVEAMDVNYILARMAVAKNQFNIVILDACRNNPFERSFRSSTAGLAAISAPRGTLIAYATAPGSVAADGQGANGLYTGELVAALRKPNLPLEQTFKLARAEVVNKSNGKQTPWESSSVIGNFVFRSEAVPQASVQAAPENPDVALWSAVKDSSNPSDYRAYLQAHPNGLYAVLAKQRIEALTAAQTEQQSRAAREAASSADTRLWNAVKDSDNQADYRAYLDAQPQGMFAVLAKQRMEALARAQTEQQSKAAREAANSLDANLWNAVKDSSNPADYQAYLDAQPKGVYAAVARRRIEVLSSARDEQFSKATREAADKAAKDALAKTQQLEQQGTAQKQVAALTPPSTSSLGTSTATDAALPAAQSLDAAGVQAYLKANWTGMQKAAKAHFLDPDNTWYYNAQVRPLDGARLTFSNVSYFDVMPSTAGGHADVIVLLQGSWMFPRNVFTAGTQAFTLYMKFTFQGEGDQLAIRDYTRIPRDEINAMYKAAPSGNAGMTR